MNRVYAIDCHAMSNTELKIVAGQMQPKDRNYNAKGLKREEQFETRKDELSNAVLTQDFKNCISEVKIGAMRGRNLENPSDRTAGISTAQRLEINENGTSNTLTTVTKDNLVVCEQRTDEGLRFFKGDVLGTLRTKDSCGDKRVIEVANIRVRKLTPRECLRLMGWKDFEIDKIQNARISNCQQYKQAGNGIVVNVLEAIFRNLFKRH